MIGVSGGGSWIRITAALLLAPAAACGRWTEPLRPKQASWQRLAVADTPLPDTAFRVHWDSHTIPPSLPHGAEADVRISFTNLGDGVWPDALSADPAVRDGRFAVRLAYDWSIAGSDAPPRPARRADLIAPVHPGETVTLLVPIVAPAIPGHYQLEIALVQELVAWFDAHGAAVLRVPVVIS